MPDRAQNAIILGAGLVLVGMLSASAASGCDPFVIGNKIYADPGSFVIVRNMHFGAKGFPRIEIAAGSRVVIDGRER